MTIVLDASMAITWLFEDETTDAARAVLDRVVEQGAATPSIWRLEIANVLQNAVRRGRCDEAYADDSITRLRRLPIEADEETDRHAWDATLKLAREESLTPYDAAYLELALRRSVPLASGDHDLIAAALRRSVAVLTP